MNADPMTLYYLGQALALLKSINGSDSQGMLPEPLKQAIDKLTSQAENHVQNLNKPSS